MRQDWTRNNAGTVEYTARFRESDLVHAGRYTEQRQMLCMLFAVRPQLGCSRHAASVREQPWAAVTRHVQASSGSDAKHTSL